VTDPDRFPGFSMAEVGIPAISSPSGVPEHVIAGGLPAVAPVRQEERISALDTIRGFAVLGILLMNICGFGLAYPAYSLPLPTAGGATGWNVFTWCFMTVVADGKSAPSSR
jgi:uncharacterized protein